jgi:hypothetical protein
MAEPHPMETRYLHRTLLVAMGFSLFFGLIVARLWFLQVYAHEEFVKRAQGQQLQEVSVQPRRATIYASNGDPLAISVSRKSVYMEPSTSRIRGRSDLSRESGAGSGALCLWGRTGRGGVAGQDRDLYHPHAPAKRSETQRNG